MKNPEARTQALHAIETPAIVVDRVVLDRNIKRAVGIATSANVELRPHAKTHKSVAIANLQLAAGAQGLTVAKTSEALVFLKGGVRDLTVAYPLVDREKIGGLVRTARDHGSRLRLIVDSFHGLSAIASAMTAFEDPVEVLMKVDVGLHRCGVDPRSAMALDLARGVHEHPATEFAGLISHAGHAYGAEGLDRVRAIAEDERFTMTTLASRIRAGGIPVDCISVGSTPTVLLSENLEGVTEIRPGNYVFLDETQVALGVATREDIALTVLSTVVSVNDRFAIIDAGSKVLSSDRGAHGSTRMTGYGTACPINGSFEGLTVTSLSEEHGFVALDGHHVMVGDRLRIYPNHACPVANLAHSLTVLDENGNVSAWPVDARGCVL